MKSTSMRRLAHRAGRAGLRWARVVALVATVAIAAGCGREESFEGRPINEWEARLKSEDPGVRLEAARAFARSAPRSPAAAHALMTALANERDDDVHVTVAEAIGRLGPEGRVAAPRLALLLKDEHAEVRAKSAFALGRIGAPADEVLPALVAALGDPEHEVRAAAAEAIGRLGPPASAATLALVRAAADPISLVRGEAVRALIQMRPDATRLVPVLTRALDDSPEENVQLAAIIALGRYGAAAAPAVPALRRAMGDEHFGLRESAARTLGRIGVAAEPAVPDLRRVAAADGDSTTRAAAAEAIAAITGRADGPDRVPQAPRP